MAKIFQSKNKIQEKNIDLDMTNIPKHIGIIMDGNGRWAKAKKLPRSMGHKAGVETIRKILTYADELGVQYVTFYAFSTENWKRPIEEVGFLMNLMVKYFIKETERFKEKNVVVKVLGDISKLPKECVDEIIRTQEETKNNTGIVMNLAINYGGRDEIIKGIKNLVNDCMENKVNIDDITPEMFSNYLYTAGMPDPDLIIRPSGEQRLSNFLIWQCAYSEFWYSDINWPDFKEENLREAIMDYQGRNRRFGGLNEQEEKK